IQNDLGREGRMAGHLDGEVAPLGVSDVEGVVVDIGLLLEQLGDLAAGSLLDLPDRGGGTGDQDQEEAEPDLMSCQVLVGDACLRSPCLQSMTGIPFALADARSRRAKRPAIRIRCALSRCSSLSPCSRRHQIRKPPGLWAKPK